MHWHKQKFGVDLSPYQYTSRYSKFGSALAVNLVISLFHEVCMVHAR